eukprot:g32050.t1
MEDCELSLSLNSTQEDALEGILPPLAPTDETLTEKQTVPLDAEGRRHGSGIVSHHGCAWEGTWVQGSREGVHKMLWPDGKASLQLYSDGKLIAERQTQFSAEALVTFELRKRVAVRDAAIRQLQKEKADLMTRLEEQKKELTAEFAKKMESSFQQHEAAKQAAQKSYEEQMAAKDETKRSLETELARVDGALKESRSELQSVQQQLERERQVTENLRTEVAELTARWELRPSKRMRTHVEVEQNSGSISSSSDDAQPCALDRGKKPVDAFRTDDIQRQTKEAEKGYECPDCGQRFLESLSLVVHCRETGHDKPTALQELLHGVGPAGVSAGFQQDRHKKKPFTPKIKFATDDEVKHRSRAKKQAVFHERDDAAPPKESSSSPFKKMFACEIEGCSSAYTQKSTLRRHYANKHPRDVCPK